MQQQEIYISSEANNWFARNKHALIDRTSANNEAIKLLGAYGYSPKKVLDIGSANGYFLDQMKKEFGCEAYGIDLSLDAINDGKERFPEINLYHGSASSLNMFADEQFDLIIISGLLCVVDRSHLLRVVAETDRVLMNKGLLINSEFESAYPIKSNYQHVPGDKVFAYKQDYTKIFTASQLYSLMAKASFNYESRALSLSDDYKNRYYYSILKKDYNLYA